MASGPAKNKRKKLIQLIHIGKGKMGLTDDAYRAFLEGITGKQSCADMTERQLAAVLRAMRKNGFEFLPRRVQPEEKGGAATAQLEYIKGMWQKCPRNKSDAALLALVNRIAHVKALRFLTVETARDVILALRDMMTKAGFDPDTSEPLGPEDQREARDG
jgi:phage gp16-like protein